MNPVDVGLILGWLACFAGAAWLSLAEVSIIRVRRGRALVAADRGDHRASHLLALIDDLPVVLNTILLLALLLQVTTAVIGGYLAQRWFGNLGVTLASVVTTLVLFLYAEAIPKTMAIRSPYRMARAATPIVSTLVTILRPVVGALVWLADQQTPGSGAQLSAFSEEELRALARESADAGIIGADDAELVERSFEFGDLRVGQVMVPRDAITFVRADQRLVDALGVAVAAGHRRLPVAGRGLDDIVGIARFRDLVIAARHRPRDAVATVTSPVLRCRPDELISTLMERMQDTGRWLAIVVDDGSDTGPGQPDPRGGTTGRTVGLATIEDLVAELVGEIAEDDR